MSVSHTILPDLIKGFIIGLPLGSLAYLYRHRRNKPGDKK